MSDARRRGMNRTNAKGKVHALYKTLGMWPQKYCPPCKRLGDCCEAWTHQPGDCCVHCGWDDRKI